jgi:choice-of-anchor A domain-containing protein
MIWTRPSSRAGFIGFFILGAIGSSWAGGSSLGNAGSFNSFIFDQASVSGGGETEGAIAVGGLGLTSSQIAFNASSNYNTLIKSDPASLGGLNNIGLYVNGNANFSSGGQLNNGGNAYVSGNFSTGNPFDLNGGGYLYYGGSLSGTVQGGSSVNSNLVNSAYFTQQQTYSQNQSAQLAGETANASINTNVANNWNVNYGGTVQNNTQYVVDLTASELAGYGGNAVTLGLGGFNSTDTLIIDVTGAVVNNFGISVNSNGLQNRILWNFENATTVDINNRQLEGSVLAADATVNQSQVIEGNLIAKNWNTYNGVELHSYNFTGTAVPEPAPYFALGIGAIGVFFKKKKK